MKFTIQREELVKGLAYVSNVVDSRAVVPILANIHVGFVDGKIVFTGSNVSSSMSVAVELLSPPDTPSPFLIQGAKILDIARTLPSETVEVALGGNGKVNIKSGKSKFSLPGLSAENFPLLKAKKEGAVATLPREAVLNCIEKTSFAAADASVKNQYEIEGVRLATKGGRMSGVALDGMRMAYITQECGEGAAETEMVIHKSALGPLVKLLKGSDTDLTLIESDGTVIVSTPLWTYSFRRAVKGFPDFTKFFPSSSQEMLKSSCNSQLLEQALVRIGQVADDDTRLIALTFKEGLTVLEVKGGKYGDSYEEVFADYEGPETTIGFNVKFLLEFIRNGVDDPNNRVIFLFSSPSKPVELHSSATAGYRYVIVPKILK